LGININAAEMRGLPYYPVIPAGGKQSQSPDSLSRGNSFALPVIEVTAHPSVPLVPVVSGPVEKKT